jgi:hypothetical protein
MALQLRFSTSMENDQRPTPGLPTIAVPRFMSGDSGEAERSFRREIERHSGMIPNTIGA